MNLLVASFADHEGLPPPGGHPSDMEGLLLPPRSLKVPELPDVVDLHIDS
jgi:hypothetical protein